MVTTAVSANLRALSSIGASVRTTPFGTTIFSTGISSTAVMRAENPGSLKIRRVASPMLVPWMVRVTCVPRCAPVGASFCRVGGAVCAARRWMRQPTQTRCEAMNDATIAIASMFTQLHRNFEPQAVSFVVGSWIGLQRIVRIPSVYRARHDKLFSRAAVGQ